MFLTHEQRDRYTRTIRKTVEWAYTNADRMEAEPDLQGHYKAPYFWAAVGDMTKAGHCRDAKTGIL